MEALLAELRSGIEDGTWAVGDRLPSESTLSQDFGVSRSVVREALRGLQALGLTQSRTGKGTYVVSAQAADSPTFGSYSARDLLEVRRHVEVPAAGYAATRHTADDMATLTDLLDRMDAETDDAFWVSLDSLFHITVARASGNPVFGKVIEEIRDALAVQSAFLNQLDDRREASNVEHRRIVEAIASGSTDQAELAMCAHLDHVDQALEHIVSRTHASSPTPTQEYPS
ncbi:FadR/GntR family transcriptional regulator [Nocardioides jiangxiensis]|uniref:FadR/GntR family transcriptional regulator n=1 Tax=Nocardioides jiangxiensis TaxID=3064524 RepID=A0ABT9B2Q8_9ACTN|nr:FadR/GntR family transcriptional regulator [Nocardioides sp. WY-20]MDO7869050.1 FadR/GntR family transcriptional regulator [Nocardioides sp. WY-20]